MRWKATVFRDAEARFRRRMFPGWMQRPVGAAWFGVVALATGWFGCRMPAKVAVHRPMVTFFGPKGVSMFLVGGHGALKVTFTGQIGPAPFLCSSHPWLVDVEGDAASVRDLMRRFSARPGGKKVMLYGRDGSLVAKGALCIFPTYKTHSRGIKRRYRIRVPAKAVSALRRKKGPVALFETYPPPKPKGRMVHVAWAMYLIPVL